MSKHGMTSGAADLEAALASLPHGPEFRFIDSLESLTPGEEGTAIYRVRGDAPFLAGHFPGAPLMPGVLLVEALAQLGGILVQSDPRHQPLPHLRLAAVRSVKILGSAKPGDTLRIEARVTGRLGTVAQIEGVISCNHQDLLRGSLALSGG